VHELHNNLGNIQRKLRRPAEAEHHYARAVAAKVRRSDPVPRRATPAAPPWADHATAQPAHPLYLYNRSGPAGGV
jgi:hypothetical protein